MGLKFTRDNLRVRILQSGVIYCAATFLIINFFGSKYVLDRNLTFVLPIVFLSVVLVFGTLFLARIIKPIDASAMQPVEGRKKENPFVFYFAMFLGVAAFWLWSEWLRPLNHLSSDELYLSGIWLALVVILIIQLIFTQGAQNAHR